jgi:hypothetical protein
MYNTEFIVKYKMIEEELIEKMNNENEEYTKEDIYDICNHLYQHELLSVFQVNDIDEIFIKKKIDLLWDTIKENSEIIAIINTYKERMAMYSIGYTDENIFVGLFNYDLFYLIHMCICKCLTNIQIDRDALEEVFTQIKNIE